MTKRHNKFGAVRIKVDGIWFDSRAEGRRYQELRLLQSAQQIANLEVHPEYVLTAYGKKLGKFTPDFRYTENGQTVIEDVKSPVTNNTMFRWKCKHLKAEHGLDVKVVMT